MRICSRLSIVEVALCGNRESEVAFLDLYEEICTSNSEGQAEQAGNCILDQQQPSTSGSRTDVLIGGDSVEVPSSNRSSAKAGYDILYTK